MMNIDEVITMMQLQSGAAALVNVMPLDTIAPPAPAPEPARRRDGMSSNRGPNFEAMYPNARVYTYKCVAFLNPAVDDLVVVDSGHEPRLGRITAVLPPETSLRIPLASLRHVIARVDTNGYADVQRAEASVRERLALAEINERLQAVQKLIPGQDLGELVRMSAGQPVVTFTPPSPPNTAVEKDEQA